MELLIFVTGVFFVAGTIKGTTGMGLPPIAMGLMVLVVAPTEAAAYMVLPAILSNIWQAFVGPRLGALLRRLWPLLLCSVAVTLLGKGWLAQGEAGLGMALLGGILILYSGLSLAAFRPSVAERHRGWLGPAVGAVQGVVTATTGVGSVPVALYMQAIGLKRDELVQALGISFTLSMVALAANLSMTRAFDASQAPAVGLATVGTLGGMYLGQVVRRRIPQEKFRVVFLVSLLLLGIYLIAKAFV